jgi:signal transduction histidine kinase
MTLEAAKTRRTTAGSPAVVAAGLTAAIGAADYFIPADYDVGVLYVLPLVVAHWAHSQAFIWILGLSLVAINQLMFGVGAPLLDGDAGVVAINRLLSSALILCLTALVDALRLQSTRLQRLHAEALGRAREAIEASNIKTRLLELISHEFRTPLTSILSWTRVLQRGRASPEVQARALATIEARALWQGRMVQDVIDAAALAGRQVRLLHEPVDLGALASAVVTELEPEFARKGVRLHTEVATRNVAVRGDRAWLERALFHVLHNALKFTPAGGAVQLALRDGDGRIQLSVQDSGRGLPQDLQVSAFELFRVGDDSNRRAFGGLGLGLFVVSEVIRLHGGQVGLHSEGPGRGTRLTATFPAA